MVCEYAVTIGAAATPEQASSQLWPGCRVVLVGEDRWGSTVTYFFLVDHATDNE